MKRNRTASVVDELLKGLERPTTCSMGRNPDLVSAIAHFLDLKASGDESVRGISFGYFYRAALRAKYDGPSLRTATEYINSQMRRDIKTGRSHAEEA